MAAFTDTQDKKWQVKLDAPTIEEIKEKHSINLVDLEHDPLINLRNDPMTLVAVTYLICQREIETSQVEPEDFARRMPSPPDPLLEAIREAIIGFFPSGQHSHVHAVLTKYDEMAAKTDQLAIAKMDQMLKDPSTEKRLSGRADKEIERLMNETFPLDQ